MEEALMEDLVCLLLLTGVMQPDWTKRVFGGAIVPKSAAIF